MDKGSLSPTLTPPLNAYPPRSPLLRAQDLAKGDAASPFNTSLRSPHSRHRGRSPIASPLVVMRASSPGSPKSNIRPATGLLASQHQRGSAPARLRGTQSLAAPPPSTAGTTSASSQLRGNSHSRALTPGPASLAGSIHTTPPQAVQGLAMAFSGGEPSGPASLAGSIRTTSLQASPAVQGLAMAFSGGEPMPKREGSEAPETLQGSPFIWPPVPANVGPPSPSNDGPIDSDMATSAMSVPAHAGQLSSSIVLSSPSLGLSSGRQTQTSVSAPAAQGQRHPTGWISPRVLPRSPAEAKRQLATPALLRSNSPASSPAPSPWQRFSTVFQASQAFAKTLDGPKSTPAQPTPATQPAEVAQPVPQMLVQSGRAASQQAQRQLGQWQKVGTVMRATRAFSQSLPGSTPSESSISQLTAVSGSPASAVNDTSGLGYNAVKHGSSVKFGTSSTGTTKLAKQLGAVPLPPRPATLSTPFQHLPQYGARLPASRSSNSPSARDPKLQRLSPRPAQGKLATIVTGALLPTDTAPLDVSGRAWQAEGMPSWSSGVTGDADASCEIEQLPAHVRETLDNISSILKNREHLKATVIKNFKAAREEEAALPSSGNVSFTDIENAALNKFEFYIFVDHIAKAMDLPPYAFGDVELEYICFDFNGHGTLNIKEVYKFVKFHLKEYRRELGGKAFESVDIPVKTPAEAGYDILEVLGRGSQGFAKLARNSSGDEVCLKVFDKKRMRHEEIHDMVEEFESMQLLSCKCIAGATEIFQDSLNYYMACELYRGGDFTQLTEKAEVQGVIMDEDWYCGIFRQCFEAIKFMHEQAVMHCDIKEHNLMLKTTDFSDPEVVIIDLGVSTCLAASDEGIPHGTPGYVPPETLETMKWFPAGDTFSMGVAMFQLVAGMKPPERGLFISGCKTSKEIFRATLEREPDWSMLPAEMPGLRNLLENLLDKERDNRPRPSKALKHYWFTGVQDNVDAGVKSSELTKNIREFYKKLAPRNNFATMGFTASMLQGFEDSEDEGHEN